MKYFNFLKVRRYTLIQIAFFWEVFDLRTGLFSSLIKFLSVFEHNFFILKFHCFMLLLNFITWKSFFFYSFFKQKGYLDMVPVFPGKPSSRFLVNFLVNIPSIALVLPPLTALVTLAICWRSLWKYFSFLLYFFSIFNNNILYLFPETCDLSGGS